MPYPDDDTIERLTRGVIDMTLPATEWTHAAHFAVALWLLRFRPELTTPAAMRSIISGYNQSTGKANTDTSGYHHTITRASMGAAAAQLAAHRADEPLHILLDGLLRSELGSPRWLLVYWQHETLFSVDARREWIGPDLASLPFDIVP